MTQADFRSFFSRGYVIRHGNAKKMVKQTYENNIYRTCKISSQSTHTHDIFLVFYRKLIVETWPQRYSWRGPVFLFFWPTKQRSVPLRLRRTKRLPGAGGYPRALVGHLPWQRPGNPKGDDGMNLGFSNFYEKTHCFTLANGRWKAEDNIRFCVS